MKIPLGLKKVAAMCILRYEQQYLLLKRNKEPNINTYVPVGGKLEPFETPYDAATRETKEETGIDVKHLKFCGTLIETSPTKYNWISYIYLADITFVEPPFCDEGILEWIAFDNLLQVPTPPTDWIIYKYVLENRSFAFSANYNESLEMQMMHEEIKGIKVYP